MTGRAELSHLFRTVGDLAATRAFWVELIGLEVIVEETGYLRVGGGDGFAMGLEQAPSDSAPDLEIVVRVPDVDSIFERLSHAGIKFEAPPEDMPWGARHVWLRDPDGRRVSLYSPLST